jgi:hypothetical protein
MGLIMFLEINLTQKIKLMDIEPILFLVISLREIPINKGRDSALPEV